MKTLTAALFAGGESRRMGADKATLSLNGEPLWSRQVRILRELLPAKLMISARSKPDWCPADVEVVRDEPPSRGPLTGLAAALGKIQTTHLLAFAIDLPQMTSAQLKKLWALARPGVGIIPQNEEFIEPLCALYPIEAVSEAREALSGEDVSLRAFISTLAAQKRIRFYTITKSERSIYQNANTPEEWKRIGDVVI